jgi:hypothetical protein
MIEIWPTNSELAWAPELAIPDAALTELALFRTLPKPPWIAALARPTPVTLAGHLDCACMNDVIAILQKIWAVLCLVATLIGTGKAIDQVATAFA